MQDILALLVVFLLGWFWLDSLRARELATGICRAACERHGVQLLDQTVSLRRVAVGRTPAGLRFRRTYGFELSDGGVGRYAGTLTLLGIDLLGIEMPLLPGAPDAPTLDARTGKSI